MMAVENGFLDLIEFREGGGVIVKHALGTAWAQIGDQKEYANFFHCTKDL